jgi:Sulfotransferase domain
MFFRRTPFRRNTLPDFLIIGAQKAGTTSLASYLAAHPNVAPAKCKEVHFFDLNYQKGIHWYRSHFSVAIGEDWRRRIRGRRVQTGEASPYYIFHPLAAARACDLLPKVRIIVLLRDPVDRAYSHYHHEMRLGAESMPFDEATDAENSRIAEEEQRLALDPSYLSFNYQHFSYLKRGIYVDQIKRWLRYYRPEQFLILSSERFFKGPAAEYQRVLRFLGLPPWDLHAYPAELAGTYEPLSTGIRDRLRKYYAQHNSELRQLLDSVWPGTGTEVVDGFATQDDASLVR